MKNKIMKNHKNVKKHLEILILLFLFALSLFINIKTSLFNKGLYICPDEIRFYEIAKNIYYNRGFDVLHSDIQFQKILWPLVLSPFFAIQDPIIRINCISIISSFLFASACLPLWLISKEFKLKYWQKILLGFMFVALPSATYTIGFMSEPLYFPLILWSIYLWIINNRKKSKIIAAVNGLLFYLIYLCKETGICFLISYAIFEIINPLIRYIISRKREKVSFLEYFKKQQLFNLGICSIVFASLYIILKLTIFKGMANSYRMDFSCFTDIKKFGYFIYANIYYIVAFCACIFIFPFILPIVLFRRISDEIRELYVYCFCLVVTFSVITVFGCVMLETLYDPIPRMDFRYFFPLYPIFFVILYSCINHKSHMNCEKKKLIIAFTTAFIIILFVYKGPGHWSTLWIDACELAWHQMLYGFIPENDYLSMLGYILLTNSLIIVLSLASIIIFAKRKRQYSSILISVSFSILCLSTRINLTDYIHNNSCYFIEENKINEMININKFLRENPNIKVMYITLQSNYTPTMSIHTYIDETDQFYCVNEKNLYDQVFSVYTGRAKISDITFYSFSGWFYTVDKFDYYIFDNRDYLLKFSNIRRTFEGQYYFVYENLNPEYIYFNS